MTPATINLHSEQQGVRRTCRYKRHGVPTPASEWWGCLLLQDALSVALGKAVLNVPVRS